MLPKSLDTIERESFNAGKSPLEYPAAELNEVTEPCNAAVSNDTLPLNGNYLMTEGGEEQPDFTKGISAAIPCTVQTALFENGTIPDPMFGKNDKAAREAAYKTWWFKKEFDYSGSLTNPTLCFDGVCHKAHFWLNGTYLGCHEGMFGGPFYKVGHILKEHNTLIIKIENSPADPKHYSEYADFDEGWKNGVVVNCVYGWHYACIPTRGIWADVYLKSTPALLCERPFIATEDYKTGRIGICIKTEGSGKGKLHVTVKPHNFTGEAQYFAADFNCGGTEHLHYSLTVKNHKLWWPNGYGGQPLYDVSTVIITENGSAQRFDETIGIRQIEMLPENGIPNSEHYNWLFSINGKYIFIKGTNWCTTDALLRCTEEKYDRFLALAKHQNLQLLRAWGGGLPETDYFYAKCDELGLMVQQEWPTCWDSPKTQPEAALIETAVLNTVRLRNHASLVRWAGGNELSATDEPSIKRMAQIAVELDGTRPFHRTSPYAGSLHSYGTYWEMEEMDSALQLRAPFIGEFGMASAPNYESIAKYIPESELSQNVSRTGKSCFNYHTPRFNEFLWPESYNDMDHLLMRASEFLEIKTLRDFILGTQLAQSVAIRHTLEAQRADSPNAAGVCYYKLTDVYPACSWSTVDYYGVPKISYYVIKNAFEPLHPMLEIKSINAVCEYPVFLLDDTLAAKDSGCKIAVKAYDRDLNIIKSEEFAVTPKSEVNPIGIFRLNDSEKEAVRIISVRLYREGIIAGDALYFQNYKNDSGCLINMPKTDITVTAEDGCAVITNNSGVPAVGVFLENLPHDTEFTAEDNFILLEGFETRKIKINIEDGLSIRALNA